MESIDTREASRTATVFLIGLFKLTLNVAILGLVASALLR